VKGVVELQAKVAETTQIRGEEDVEVLDTLIETQGLLQQTVIRERGREREYWHCCGAISTNLP
jgi:hypothetical protein